MNSREFLKTSCEILFKAMNIAIEKTESGEIVVKRSATIPNYLKRNDNKPYSKTIFEIFKARIEYYIYPEQYEREVNETEINVFLNKCMYLLSVMFDLNFSYLRCENFNESRKWAKDYILMVAKEFSTRYECEKEEFINFFTKYTTKTMHTNNKYTHTEIEEYFKICGQSYYSQEYLSLNNDMVSDYIEYKYKQTIEYLEHCWKFFDVLLKNAYYNNEVRNATKTMYRETINRYNILFNAHLSNILNIDEKDIKEKSNSEYWKFYVSELAFKYDENTFNPSVLFCINDILHYIFRAVGEYSRFICLMKEFEKFNELLTDKIMKTYNKYKEEIRKEKRTQELDKLIKTIDRNSFIFFDDPYYNDIISKIHDINKFILLKRRVYFILEVEMNTDEKNNEFL